MRVKVIGSTGETSVLEGALTGIDGIEKIVRIDGRGVDMRATGRNLFFGYTDVPGALGAVGTALGGEGINVEAAALTQGKKETDAMLILRIDRVAPDPLLESINDRLGAVSSQLDFDA